MKERMGDEWDSRVHGTVGGILDSITSTAGLMKKTNIIMILFVRTNTLE